VKRNQRAGNQFLGGNRPSFRFRASDDGELVPDEAERMRGRGKSLRYIAGKLALEGHRLNRESVRRLLAR